MKCAVYNVDNAHTGFREVLIFVFILYYGNDNVQHPAKCKLGFYPLDSDSYIYQGKLVYFVSFHIINISALLVIKPKINY